MSKYGRIYKTRFSEIGFTMIEPGCWQFLSLMDGEPSQVGSHYPTKAEIMVNIERYAAEYGCDGANKPNVQTPSDGLLAQIANRYLGIKTLEIRNSDSLDFYSLSVWNVKAALEAAWKAGVNEERKASQ